ncbi:MAG: hypothetical protein C0405_12730, partial [Desulfovibrio sp.]|nr:hypothetical protein [Desulfovibrio sp.]
SRAALEVLGVGGGEDVRRLQAQAPRPPAKAQPLAGDATPAFRLGVMPDLKGYTLRQVMSLARAQHFSVKLKGWGRVVAQSPAPGAPLPQDHTLAVELAPAAEGGA